MLTKMVARLDGGIAFAFHAFPPQFAAKAEMHVHPIGDRVNVVLEGTGHAFLRTANGFVDTRPMGPGDVVLFPQGTSHAFWGGKEKPMTVQVMLNPYIPLDHPLHTVCAEKARNLSEHPELIAMHDVNDPDALAKIVSRLVEEGELDLGKRQWMGWGDEVVSVSVRKITTPDDVGWECGI